MARVTGIGGVFFKAKDPEALAAWYRDHLGMPMHPQYGCAIIQWEQDSRPDGGQTVWSLAKSDTDWFKPSESSFMINYRVDDMAGLVEKLNSAGIAIVKGPDTDFNGIFTWILDPEGNKVELWQPMEGVPPPG